MLKNQAIWFSERITAWKVSKYVVISGPYFPVFSPNTGKYGPEITPYLDTFHAVNCGPKRKNQTVKLLEMTELICYFCGWLHHRQKICIIAQFNLDIFNIKNYLGMPRFAWPHPYECTEANICIYICLTKSIKSTSYLSSFFRYS